MKKGLVLSELLVVIAVFLILSFVSLRAVRGIIQKSRVVSAKAQIAQLAQLLEKVRDDTGDYPVSLMHLKYHSPPSGIERGWTGPYLNAEIPLDPWGTPYFYMVPPTDVFDPPPIVRGRAQPQTLSIPFPATAQTASMRIENYGTASAWVEVNGVRIFNTHDFNHQPPLPQIYEREVDLQDGENVMDVWIASGPGRQFIVYISGYFPTDEYFILGSYGKDGDVGGKGYDADITWVSNRYPNFMRGDE